MSCASAVQPGERACGLICRVVRQTRRKPPKLKTLAISPRGHAGRAKRDTSREGRESMQQVLRKSKKTGKTAATAFAAIGRKSHAKKSRTRQRNPGSDVESCSVADERSTEDAYPAAIRKAISPADRRLRSVPPRRAKQNRQWRRSGPQGRAKSKPEAQARGSSHSTIRF